jgi:hypothetical protein
VTRAERIEKAARALVMVWQAAPMDPDIQEGLLMDLSEAISLPPEPSEVERGRRAGIEEIRRMVNHNPLPGMSRCACAFCHVIDGLLADAPGEGCPPCPGHCTHPGATEEWCSKCYDADKALADAPGEGAGK